MDPVLVCILYIKGTCKAILIAVVVSFPWKDFPLSTALASMTACYCLYKIVQQIKAFTCKGLGIIQMAVWLLIWQCLATILTGHYPHR